MKIDPKIHPKTSKKAPLAVNDRKQGRRTKQNRIFWLRPPVKVPNGDPKGYPKTFRRRLQPAQNASKAGPRGVLEVNHLENLILLRMYCTESKVLQVPSSSHNLPKTLKNAPRTLSSEPWRPLKEGSETGTPQKSFFAPDAIWGEPAFEAWTRERGPQLYIDMYCY